MTPDDAETWVKGVRARQRIKREEPLFDPRWACTHDLVVDEETCGRRPAMQIDGLDKYGDDISGWEGVCVEHVGAYLGKKRT